MREKIFLCFAVLSLTCFLLTGCAGQLPDLTEEEYNQTIEYAVGLLMKYSNNDQEKITYVNASEVQKQRDKETREAAKQEENENTTQTQNTTKQDKIEQTEPVQNQSVVSEDSSDVSNMEASNTSSAGSYESTEQDADAITLSSEDSQEIYDGIFLSYQGYSVSSTYPESSKSYVVNADKGKKLLVLRFDVYNSSDTSKEVSMLDLNLMFQIILNGKNLGYSSVTFLPNDLSSFEGTIESKAHESLVVLSQIDEDESTSIESIELIVIQNEMEQKVYLK